MQTGEYATDEEEEMSPVFPNSIEVFDLAENQEMLSPVELDPEKLAHKFKEVFVIWIIHVVVVVAAAAGVYFIFVFLFVTLSLAVASNQTCSNPGRDSAAEEKG